MRSYKTVVKEAELMASPPEVVQAFLARRASYSKAERRSDEVDDELEAALRTRNDPLVNLALAKHGKFIATVMPMFQTGEASAAIRLAILANTTLDGEVFSDFPTTLFGGAEQMAAWLLGASSVELSALFQNPNLSDSFLRDFLEGSEPWNTVPDETKATIVAILAGNERMRAVYDDSFLDGYAEYSFGAVFDAAWKLAERVPATDRWAAALRWLYDGMRPEAFSIDNPLDLAARWRFETATGEIEAKESKAPAGGFLSAREAVRKGLARLALAKDRKLLSELLDSDDPGLRCAAYSDGDLAPAQLEAAYDKDGELSFNEAVNNQNLWRTAPGREALRRIAWAVVNNDRHSDLMAANTYNGIKEDHQKKHPSWFEDEEDFGAEPSDEPATKADVLALAERMDAPAPGTEQIKQMLLTANSRIGWVWWFSLGALFASLRHI